MECNDIEEAYIYSEITISKKVVKDDRLFPGIPLYCEGHEKPLLRGMSHLLCTLFLFYGLYDMYTEANGNFTGQISAILYVISNIWCYGISALYHVGKWSAKTEILLQKLDHCGIAILGCGTMLPVSFLLLPYFQGFLLAFSSIIIATWTCWHIINLRPSVFRLALNGCTLIPFVPQLYYFMDKTEYTCTLLVFVFQLLGMIVFIAQKPNLLPKIFGYHEIFHLFVICAGACVYITNWGVIRRVCNPDESRLVWEDICDVYHFLTSILS